MQATKNFVETMSDSTLRVLSNLAKDLHVARAVSARVSSQMRHENSVRQSKRARDTSLLTGQGEQVDGAGINMKKAAKKFGEFGKC